MIEQILLFVVITMLVGGVNLLLGDPPRKPIWRELLGFFVVVVGGIAAFTAVIVVTSALFQ